MWTALSPISLVVGRAPLLALATQTAELPPVDQLQEQMGLSAETVSVYEPHLRVGDSHVEVEYVGYRAVDVIAHVLGEDWRSRAGTIEFRALDGYVSLIDVGRFQNERAFIVFARKDNAPFTVDNIAQNETDVPLGPYYLVWDNTSDPALLAEGARYWPYQVTDINLVTVSDAALLPAGLDARFAEGAEFARTHCLSCHRINGLGGEKFQGNLTEIARRYPEADFLRLVLTPASGRTGSSMPALPDRLPEPECQRIAKAVFDYLNNVPVLP